MRHARTFQNKVFTGFETYLTGLIIEPPVFPPNSWGGKPCGRVATVCPLLRKFIW